MTDLTLIVNEQPVFNYDRQTELTEEKLSFLENMDRDMSRGVRIRGELIAEPDTHQRAEFVALNLIKALQQDNQAIIQASCAYLVSRLPDLVEVHAKDQDGGVKIELVEQKLN